MIKESREVESKPPQHAQGAKSLVSAHVTVTVTVNQSLLAGFLSRSGSTQSSQCSVLSGGAGAWAKSGGGSEPIVTEGGALQALH